MPGSISGKDKQASQSAISEAMVWSAKTNLDVTHRLIG